MRRKIVMKRPSSYLFAIVVLATTAMLAINGRTTDPSAGSEAQFAAHGAFRDGLYMGRFAAEHDQPSHPGIGRWSTHPDRAMFHAGYQRGYGELVTRAGANAKQPAE
jgi:hypothetical protein